LHTLYPTGLFFEQDVALEATSKRVLAGVGFRYVPDLEKDTVNDRKADLTGPWLETVG
jgi:hypothetical protein